ncbi:MAG TPA: hypothetical protein VFH47_04885, partial [Candidatus Thermoplasmatota archaeon]|nr:hypothetical protein [Candidatus Thermoplasmatota archaeon]
MMRPALLSVVLLSLAVPLAAAQPAQDLNQTANEAGGLLDRVLGDVKQAGDGLGDAVGGAADGATQAASGLGDFLGRAARAAGQAVAAGAAAAVDAGAGVALAAAGAAAAAAAGAAAASGWAGGVLGDAAQLIGEAAAFAAAAVAAALAAAFGLAWGGMQALRPGFLPPAAFAGVAAAGAAATAGVGGWALASWLRRLGLLAPFGLAGFSRIEDAKVLDHPVRSQLFEAIRANPGIHASALGRVGDVGWGTVVHHLDRLEKAKLVTTRRVGGQKCYFENGGKVGRQDMAVASAVRSPTAGQIAAYVQDHP